MNLQSILITNGIGVTLAVILFLCFRPTQHRHELEGRQFMLLIVFSGASCLLEGFTYLIDGRLFPGARLISLLSNSGLYANNITFSFLWSIYVDYHLYRSRERLKAHFKPLGALYIILMLGILGNLFGGYLFTISAENVYSRLPLCYLYFAAPLFFILSSALDLRSYRKNQGHRDFFPIWMFLVPFIIGAMAQVLVYGISLAWCSVVIGITAMHMSLQNELSYLDALTGLYNRAYLRRLLTSSDWNHSQVRGGIMIDIDYFKEINDNYGHSAGDEALCDAAAILRQAAPETATVIRFAGDEFVIVTRSRDNEDLLAIMDQITRLAEEYNAHPDHEYHLSFSMGHCLTHPQTETSEQFMREIDDRMYENKRQHHRERYLNDPSADRRAAR